MVLVGPAHGKAVDEMLLMNLQWELAPTMPSSSADRCKEIALITLPRCACTPYLHRIEATSVGMTSKRAVRTFMHYVG